MYILAFETTGKNASVACIDDKGSIVCESGDGVYNHLQSLMPMTQTLMTKNGIALKDIRCVAASVGPGSFTGIRIGVSTARAFAQAAGVPCISVPTLQTFVYNIPDYRGVCCPVFDARRGQIYGGAYSLGAEGEIQEVVTGGAYIRDDFLEILNRKTSDIKYFGDGAQSASSVAKLALELYKKGKQIDYQELIPQYMRKPEAERKLEAEKNG